MIKKIFNSKKGFSLIELLISITIMGVLATIILNSVSNSRARAYDTKIKQQLNRFRSSAEIYFINQTPNSYGPSVPVCTAGIFSDTDPVNGSPGIYLQATNLPSFTQVVCGANGSSYAVKATLFSGDKYWCVDNKNNGMMITGPIGSSVVSCQ